MKIEGVWHQKGSSTQHQASLEDSGDFFTLFVEKGIVYEGELLSLKVEGRLGNTPRRVTLEDGSVFITTQNDAVDRLFYNTNPINRILHFFEKNIFFVFIAIAFTALFSVTFVKKGIPYLSQQIAYALPYQANEMIASNSLAFLDAYLFEKSELSTQEQDKIKKLLKKILVKVDEGKKLHYHLHFRKWNEGNISVANALALPSGDIIVTDKFISLCQSDDEIASVLLHEIGHIVHRHTLKMMIEGTFLSVAVIFIVGDSSMLGDMGIGVASLLMSSSYSRDNEAQADSYAFKKMLLLHIDPKAFSVIMQKISISMPHQKEAKEKNIFDYFSSHPKTQNRIEEANRFSQCFKEKKTLCNP